MSRWISVPLAIVCLAVPLCITLKYWHEVSHVSPGLDVIHLTEYAKEAIEFNRERNNSVAQLAILLIGGLWALIIGKDRAVRLNFASWCPFIAANVSLVFSYALYLVSINRVVEYLFKADNIDLFAPAISIHSNYQIYLFSSGVVFSVLFALLFYLQRKVEP